MKNQKYYPNYVAMEYMGEDSEVFCPVCGRPITPGEHACPHLLFLGVYGSIDPRVMVDHVHPKLNRTDDAMEKELFGTEPIAFVSKLNLNPANTLVLSSEYVFEAPTYSELVYIVAVIELPCSDELKAWKQNSKNPIEPAPQPAPQ